MTVTLPSPVELGLPPKFAEWRQQQAEAVEWNEANERRFVVNAAPTGFGKSPVYIASAMLTTGRVCILTSTKGLQDQLARDFGEVGLVDIRGMNSYQCVAAKDYGLAPSTNCDQAPCHHGAQCQLKHGGCLYYDQLRLALCSRLVSTNYSYWMHMRRFSATGLGEYQLLIIDEAHAAPDELSKFMSVTISPSDLGWLLQDGRTPNSVEIADWVAWATTRLQMARSVQEELTERIERACARLLPPPPGAIQRAQKLKGLIQRLEVIEKARDEWAIEREESNWKLEPVWPAPYAEQYLFQNIPKVMLFSATVRPKTMSMLGVKYSEFSFQEYQSTFPIDRRPIAHVPTISLKYTSPDSDLGVWLNRIDQIISQRLNRKGLVHCTSYARRDLLVHNSEHRRLMVWHGKDDTADVVARFKASPNPCVLVSPSVTTGWDFPGRECEYIIIAKVPFLNFTSALSRRRSKTDAEWDRYTCVQTLIQSSGRGMRSCDDSCEVLIVDDQIERLVRDNRAFFPNWWLQAYRKELAIPAPLPKL